jgi:DNA-binding NtrC family response regulator
MNDGAHDDRIDADRLEDSAVPRLVLVADDEPAMRLLCRVNLELEGYDVCEAETGTEALARVQDGGIDLILLDIMMPGLGGHDVARQLARDERTRRLPVVFLSARADRAFITVNSGNLPPDLLESNLFGHVKGAFTGAMYPKKGLFELADKGTIFFDEIGNIPLETQAKLLRVIQ